MNRTWLLVLTGLALTVLGASAYLLGARVGAGAERGAAPIANAAGTRLDTPPYVGDVVLEQAGRGRVALADFGGRYLILYFGYTNCPDVCPLTLARLAETVRALGDPEALQVAMITVDPETDTPERVQRYVAGFHPAFIGLSGSQQQVAEAIETFFIAARRADEALVVHSDVVLLVDPEGRWRVVYGQTDIPALGADLERLLASR